MSVKIKVSYTEDGELAGVIRLLSPMLRNVKVQPQKGRFKRAYIDLKGGGLPPVLVTKNTDNR